jgi:hypothetical protein
MSIQFKDVYYVTSNDPKSSLNPIAIKPEVRESIKTALWEDTSKGKSVRYKSYQVDDPKTPQKITIITDYEVITLVRLTLDIYNKFLKQHVAKQPSFSSDKELREFYLNHDFGF